MTDDLVNRLRWLGDHASFEPHMHHVAADRIEALEAEMKLVMEINERLLAALRKIADLSDYRLPSHRDIARAALAGEKKDG